MIDFWNFSEPRIRTSADKLSICIFSLLYIVRMLFAFMKRPFSHNLSGFRSY